MLDETCTWEYDDNYEYYNTDCAHTFYFVDESGIGENQFKFCPYCGKKIVEVQDAE